MDKVEQSYWDSSYSSYKYDIVHDDLTRWLEQQLGNSRGSAFEAGCFPGRYLGWLGKQGWVVNGMDLTPRMDTDFRDWLAQNNIAFGKIEKGDVLAYMKNTPDRYDLVCSFGFIEHFENFLDIIALHTHIVKPGGKLIITTPHFRGFVQRWLHKALDRENYNRHYVPSMNPALWKKRLEESGFDVQWAGYFGRFDFWADRQKRNLIQKVALKAAYSLTSLLRRLPDSRHYSPYCGIVASRKQ